MPARGRRKEVQKKGENRLEWKRILFLIGIVVAILGAILSSWAWVFKAELIIGLLIGLGLLFEPKGVINYFVGGIALVVVTAIGGSGLPLALLRFLQYLVLLVMPGVVLLAVRCFWDSY